MSVEAQAQSQTFKEKPSEAEVATNTEKPKIKISGITFTGIIFAKIFKQRSSFVLLMLSAIVTIIFSVLFVTAKNDAAVLSYFDYFFIVFMSFIIFVSIMKITQTIWKTQFEDKSIVIYQAQSISRVKLFLSMFFASFLLILVIIAINLFIMLGIFLGIRASINMVFIKFWITLLFYSIIAAFCLVCFCTFVNLVFSQSFTLILFTFLLAATFICSLPYQFYRQSLDGISARFMDTKQVWGGTTDTIWKVKDMENRLDFQKYVTTGRIKYPDLSYWVNDFYIRARYIQANFDRSSPNCKVDWDKLGTCALQERESLWQDLGILKTSGNTVAEMKKVKLKNVPSSDPNWDTSVYPTKNEVVDFHFEFVGFISREDIDDLLETYKVSESEADVVRYKVLKDFAELYDNLLDFFTKQALAKNQSIPEDLQLEPGEYRMFLANASKFGPLLDYKTDKSRITGADGQSHALSEAHFQSLVRSYVEPNQSLALNVQTDSATRRAFEAFITKAYEPVYLVARIIENYFIGQTSDFTYITNLTIQKNADWDSYINKTNSAKFISNFNFLENFLQFFTANRGFAYNDFWFEPESTSSISFENQKNLFLSYDEPKMIATPVSPEDDKILELHYDKWLNYKSNRWMFVTGYAVTSVILIISTAFIFKKMDIN